MKIICDHCEAVSQLDSVDEGTLCPECGERLLKNSCSSSGSGRQMSEYMGLAVTLIYFFAALYYFYMSLFKPEFFIPGFRKNIHVFRLALGLFTFMGGFRLYLRLRRFF